MEHKEAGCQAPEGPILCINNCGFFGSAATMHMCSKCHKDMVLKEEQTKLAASSIDSIVNGGTSSSAQDLNPQKNVDVVMEPVEPMSVASELSLDVPATEITEPKPKTGPTRCNACNKRVGLSTGFNCRCGNIFCAAHRYSDKHNCEFDYRSEARNAIAIANPVIKADKLDKI